jgi:hypothetical protein
MRSRPFTQDQFVDFALGYLNAVLESLIFFGDKEMYVEGGPRNLYKNLPSEAGELQAKVAGKVKVQLERFMEGAQKANPIIAQYTFKFSIEDRRGGKTILFVFGPTSQELMNKALSFSNAYRKIGIERDEE